MNETKHSLGVAGSLLHLGASVAVLCVGLAAAAVYDAAQSARRTLRWCRGTW